MKRMAISIGLMFGLAFVAPAMMARAQSSSDDRCHKGRNDAAAKFAACEQRATARFSAGGDLARLSAVLAKCRAKYSVVWAKLRADAAGTTSACDGPRFVVADGTVVDALTGLQWEQKTAGPGLHDANAFFSWTEEDGVGVAPDGTTFTQFLPALNSGPCFAGHCDWRLPTRIETQTIMLTGPAPCSSPACIDQTLFGPITGPAWSATSVASDPLQAWLVTGVGVEPVFKLGTVQHIRAVRGGS